MCDFKISMWGEVFFWDFFASTPACGSPYMDRLISTYTYPFFAFCRKLYCCMICSVNADKGILIHSYWFKRVQS